MSVVYSMVMYVGNTHSLASARRHFPHPFNSFWHIELSTTSEAESHTAIAFLAECISSATLSFYIEQVVDCLPHSIVDNQIR